jgi:S1-C subfamily serine protease
LLIGGNLHVGGGSGVMIRWEEYRKFGYILTAYHVIDSYYERGTSVPVSWQFPNSSPVTEMGIVFEVDQANDIAIVRITTRHEVFDVMSSKEYDKLKKFRMLISCGYPFSAHNGIIISYGFIKNISYNGKMLLHSCTDWYGFSGGPIIDLATCQLVGIEVTFGPMRHSSSSIAVPAPTINTFLRSIDWDGDPVIYPVGHIPKLPNR